MRLIKMLGLAVVAALVSMAFIGAGTASAQTFTYVCNEEKLENCTSGTVYEEGDQLEAELQAGTEAELSGTLPVNCEESSTTSELGENPVKVSQIQVQITALTFKKCSNLLGSCTVKTLQLPYEGKLSQQENQGDASLQIREKPGKGQPGAEIICGLTTCTFSVAEGAGEDEGILEVLGGEGGSETSRVRINAKEVKLKRTAGSESLCGNEATWKANYEVTKAFVGGSKEEIVNPPGWVTHGIV